MNKDKLIAEFMYWDINDPRTFPKTCQQPIYDGCWGITDLIHLGIG